jgi:anaerobic magnesium-protoporphyrin IX monomethyl ester cyclase
LKVLFIHPPVRLRGGPEDIPFGLAMLAAIAEEEGHQVAFLDLNANRIPLQIAGEEIALDNYDVIAVGGLSSQFKDICRIIPVCRRIHPNAQILAGGGFATYMPDKILNILPEIDIVGIGEGEEIFREILQVGPNGDYSKIKGIAYKDDSGNVVFTEPRPLIKDMDTLPYPAYHLLDLEKYFEYSEIIHSKESSKAKKRIDIITQRGCPRQCTFCTHNGMNRWDQEKFVGKEKLKLMDKEYGFQAVSRLNSPEYVVKHMKFLHENYDIDFCYILDENLTSDKKYLRELCKKMIDEELPKVMHWGTAGDTASVSDESVHHMQEAGCTFITFGGESGSDKVLKYDIGKGCTAQMNQNAVDIMKRQKMEPIMTFMVGNPSEDINDVLETTEFFIKNNILCKPFICTPYPGTKLFMDYENMILSQFDDRLDQLKNLPENSVPAEMLKQWKLEALKKFLVALDDADVLSAHVSQVFDHGDLLAIQQLMFDKDMERLLKLAHLRNWSHDEKWDHYCPVCNAKKSLNQLIQIH